MVLQLTDFTSEITDEELREFTSEYYIPVRSCPLERAGCGCEYSGFPSGEGWGIHCYTEKLDALRRWREMFFWVDDALVPWNFAFYTQGLLPRDERPPPGSYSMEDAELINENRIPINAYSEAFLCHMGISRNYFQRPEEVPTFIGDDGRGAAVGKHRRAHNGTRAGQSRLRVLMCSTHTLRSVPSITWRSGDDGAGPSKRVRHLSLGLSTSTEEETPDASPTLAAKEVTETPPPKPARGADRARLRSSAAGFCSEGRGDPAARHRKWQMRRRMQCLHGLKHVPCEEKMEHCLSRGVGTKHVGRLDDFRQKVEGLLEKQEEKLRKLSIEYDEELYPHMLSTIAERRWLISHGLRLAAMSTLESQEVRQSFGCSEVVALVVAMKLFECLISHSRSVTGFSPFGVIRNRVNLARHATEGAEAQPDYFLKSDVSQLQVPIFASPRDILNPFALEKEVPLKESLEAQHMALRRRKGIVSSWESWRRLGMRPTKLAGPSKVVVTHSSYPCGPIVWVDPALLDRDISSSRMDLFFKISTNTCFDRCAKLVDAILLKASDFLLSPLGTCLMVNLSKPWISGLCLMVEVTYTLSSCNAFCPANKGLLLRLVVRGCEFKDAVRNVIPIPSGALKFLLCRAQLVFGVFVALYYKVIDIDFQVNGPLAPRCVITVAVQRSTLKGLSEFKDSHFHVNSLVVDSSLVVHACKIFSHEYLPPRVYVLLQNGLSTLWSLPAFFSAFTEGYPCRISEIVFCDRSWHSVMCFGSHAKISRFSLQECATKPPYPYQDSDPPDRYFLLGLFMEVILIAQPNNPVSLFAPWGHIVSPWSQSTMSWPGLTDFLLRASLLEAMLEFFAAMTAPYRWCQPCLRLVLSWALTPFVYLSFLVSSPGDPICLPLPICQLAGAVGPLLVLGKFALCSEYLLWVIVSGLSFRVYLSFHAAPLDSGSGCCDCYSGPLVVLLGCSCDSRLSRRYGLLLALFHRWQARQGSGTLLPLSKFKRTCFAYLHPSIASAW
ncbi:hypothetical protein Tco_0241153 [Tanacetum coccineum]